MQFANQTLWALLLPLFFVFLGLVRHRRREKRLLAFADIILLPELFPLYKVETRQNFRYSFWLFVIAILLSLSLIRPQWGYILRETTKKGIDIVFALDLSESMLTEDVSPNRLLQAKRKILDFLDHLQGDRVALVSFAGIAFVESPLTTDYVTFRLFLESLSPSSIPVQGTNMKDAFTKSIEVFRLSATEEGNKKLSTDQNRAVVFFSDGEDVKGNFDDLIAQAKENNISLYALGFGTTEGRPIPDANGFKKNKDGQIVISKLHPETLLELTTKTGGIFTRASIGEQDMSAIYNQGIRQSLKQKEFQGGPQKHWNEYYQVPLFFAIVGILISLLNVDVIRFTSENIVRRKTFDVNASPYSWNTQSTASLTTKSDGLPSKQLKLSVIIFLLLLGISSLFPKTVLGESKEKVGKKASEAFKKGDFKEALSQFTHGQELEDTDSRFSIGKGASYYRLGKYEEAKKSFLEATKHTASREEKASSLYNAGNSFVQLGELEQAIKAYEESLQLAPNDQDAKENLEYVKQLLQQQKNDPNQSENDNQKSNSDQNNKSNQNKQTQQDQEDKGKTSYDSDQLESLLDNVEDNKAPMAHYRRQKALDELKKFGEFPFQQDW